MKIQLALGNLDILLLLQLFRIGYSKSKLVKYNEMKAFVLHTLDILFLIVANVYALKTYKQEYRTTERIHSLHIQDICFYPLTATEA